MNRTPGGPPEARDDLSGAISGMLGAEIESSEMPSASLLVMRRGAVASRGALGRAVVEPERIDASPDTIYDLASLTKPLVTTTLVLLAAGEGRIALDDPVGRYPTELSSHPHLAGTTWRDLLAHRAGFEAWYPLYVRGCDRSAYLRTILSLPPAYAPGTSVTYSDLGFVLLFIALERAWGEDFDTLARNRIFRPLGAERCGFLPAVELRAQIAATERGNEKERELARARGLSFSGWREGVICTGRVTSRWIAPTASQIVPLSRRVPAHPWWSDARRSVAEASRLHRVVGRILQAVRPSRTILCSAEAYS